MSLAHAENARTLAGLLGLAEGEVTGLLDATVLVTCAPTGMRLAGHIQTLLARTLTNVLMEPHGNSSPTLEILIGDAPARTAAPSIAVSVLGFRLEVAETAGALRGAAAAEITELLASCYAAAAAVHRVLDGRLPMALPLPIRVDLAQLYGDGVEALSQRVDVGTCTLVGAGAIGNAFVRGLSVLDVHGDVCVCDPDIVSGGNLNRCCWFGEIDVGLAKVTQLDLYARPNLPGLRIESFVGTLRELQVERGEPLIETMIVAVDSRRARRSLQSEMPRQVFDASTTGVSEIVLHANEACSGLACLSCIYFEAPDERAHERHVAATLGVTDEDVRTNYVEPAAAAAIVRKHPGLVAAAVAGMAYDSLFKELCGTASLEDRGAGRVLAPFGFVSLLAGVMLAIEFVVRRKGGAERLPYNYWRLSPWATPVPRLREQRGLRSGCEFCGNANLQSVVANLWGPAGSRE